jgi:RNase adaptor protein for sRNA GlmZ degradation
LAIDNLNHLFANKLIAVHLPEIENISTYLSQSEWAKQTEQPKDQLTIRVTSFSYKKGIPRDPSENGGGFVFDCRGLPNPGRLAEYRTCSGLDQNVVEYLEQYDEVEAFQQNARSIVAISVKEYLQRKFNHLCINFGCTGGQHRSVYHAEKFSAWLQNNYPVNVVLIHNEKDNWKRNG